MSIVFPHGIGCGLARGPWPHYCHMIERFAEENQSWRVMIVSRVGTQEKNNVQKGEKKKAKRRREKNSKKKKELAMIPTDVEEQN